MLDKPLAIVDVETTGLSPTWDRVIEICILRVENGRIIDKVDTLINPQTSVSPFIESMTGIKRKELEEAPIFLEVQERILEILKGAVFVAHNVNFDYSFIKEEFKRLQFRYTARTLCTVRLSRRLFPSERSHSLSSLITRYNFSCSRRHRAYDDAHVLYQFLTNVTQNIPAADLKDAISIVMKNYYSHNEALNANIEELPEGPGVYIFYDKENNPLYVGKSVNIKERVKSHLTPVISGARDFSMMNNLSRIEYIKTAGELGALLLESEKIKELQPVFNRRLRLKKRFLAVFKTTDNQGFFTLESKVIGSFKEVDFDSVYGIFKSKRNMKEMLSYVAKQYKLCGKILGIENSKKACFEYKLGRCKGACIAGESPHTYNKRFLIAYIENKQFRPWRFSGPIEIAEKNEEEELYESFIIDKWCLLGKRTYDNEITYTKEVAFDLDSYKIMTNYLKYKKASIKKIDLNTVNTN